MSRDDKFSIIQATLADEDNMLQVGMLCEIAGVSRSGYYRWVKAAAVRQKREEADQRDFEVIVNAYKYRGYPKGARGIYMRLLHQTPPVVMNLKKIRRLMQKYSLFCPVREANPYKRLAKVIRTSVVVDNIVNREFTKHGPRKILLTDITYIAYLGTHCYLSTILDAFTKEVLAYKVSDSLEVDFVLDTVKQLIKEHGVSLSTETLVHSDQGCHYTSVKFRQLLKDKGLRQSMSGKANCWDNAPQESFFGHMKDEIDISGCKDFRGICAVISDWMDYYNNERYQWGLAKLSPKEYYRYVTTGEYPIKV